MDIAPHRHRGCGMPSLRLNRLHISCGIVSVCKDGMAEVVGSRPVEVNLSLHTLVQPSEGLE